MNNYFKLETPSDVYAVIPRLSFVPIQNIFDVYNDMNKVIDKFNMNIQVNEKHSRYIHNVTDNNVTDKKDTLTQLAMEVDKASKNMKLPVNFSKAMSTSILSKTITIESISDKIDYIKSMLSVDCIDKILNANSIEKCKIYFKSLRKYIDELYSIYVLIVKNGKRGYDDINNIVIQDITNYMSDENIPIEKRICYIDEIKFISSCANTIDINNKVSLFELLTLSTTFKTLLLDEMLNSPNDNIYDVKINNRFQYNGLKKYLEDNKGSIKVNNNIEKFTERNLCISEIEQVLLYGFMTHSSSINISLDFKDFVYLSDKVDKLYIWDLFDTDNSVVVCKKNGINYLVDNDINTSTYLLYEMNMDLPECIMSHKQPVKTISIPHEVVNVLESANDCHFDMDILTEGIDIDKEGNVKFTFSDKKTYMSQYAENHRELVNNMKVGNIEGAKTNLAFIFAMVSVIERDVIYSDKNIDEVKLEDAKQARMFARNDFATYLPQIQRVDRKFDFSKYYHDNNYDKYVLTLKTDSIVGIKKIMNTLFLKI